MIFFLRPFFYTFYALFPLPFLVPAVVQASELPPAIEKAGRCPTLSYDEFSAFLKEKPRPLTLVFFSSWCSDCKSHLQALSTSSAHENVILIHSFPVSQKPDEVLQYFGVSAKIPCVNDKFREITAHYGVHQVPAQIQIGERPL